ncbi:hypothetical protein PUR28_12260, partial [Streptomyces sp. BE308]|uniref:hypothetical protein n=1 Tax=Streptomyces sp. BE308 TaxID=3002529 RepID=UPI002E769BE3
QPELPLSRLSPLGHDEATTLIEGWNASSTPVPADAEPVARARTADHTAQHQTQDLSSVADLAEMPEGGGGGAGAAAGG